MNRFASYVRYLLFITAFVLTILAAGTLMRVNENTGMRIFYILYAVLMLGDAFAMLFCGLYINRKMKLVFWFAVIVLGLNIVLTLFDQIGLVDLLFSLFNLITLAALIILRKEFLPQ